MLVQLGRLQFFAYIFHRIQVLLLLSSSSFFFWRIIIRITVYAIGARKKVSCSLSQYDFFFLIHARFFVHVFIDYYTLIAFNTVVGLSAVTGLLLTELRKLFFRKKRKKKCTSFVWPTYVCAYLLKRKL